MPGDRIYVCSAGRTGLARSSGARRTCPPDGYVLFLGTLEPRKNIGALLDAYEALLAARPDAPPLVHRRPRHRGRRGMAAAHRAGRRSPAT